MGIIVLVPFFAFTQTQNVPLNQSFSVELEKNILKSQNIIHSSFKPILNYELRKEESVSALKYERRKDKSWAARKLFYEHFVLLDTGKIQLTIDPLFNFELGEDRKSNPRGDVSLYRNTRGFKVNLLVGGKVAVESTFRENQAVLPYYLSQRTASSGVAHGQGRTKSFKENGVDFSMASSYLSYSPSNRINIQIGDGKHFVGNGHRSLLLSDLAFNYPFLKLNTNWFNNKLQYQNLYSLYQDLSRLESNSFTEGLFERKQGATHYLEYSPNNKMSIGLFESTIFPSLDSSGNIGVGGNYWVPIIFLNSLVEREKEKGNNLLGVNLSYNLFHKVQLYGQLAMNGENNSFQFGTKFFLHKNLMLQGEYNSLADVRSNSLFHHYNESLTHPIGYESSEIIGIIQYKKNRILSRAMLNMIQAKELDVTFADFRQSYIINPTFNFTAHVGIQIRSVEHSFAFPLSTVRGFQGGALSHAAFIYFGLSTNLQNLYFNY